MATSPDDDEYAGAVGAAAASSPEENAPVKSMEKHLLSSGWGDETDNSKGADNDTEGQTPTWSRKFGAKRDDGDGDEPEETQQANAYSWNDRDDNDDASESRAQSSVETTRGARSIASGIDDLPLFADDKNKELHKKIRAKEKLFHTVETEIAENKSRVEIMTEHLKNVKQELLHTQELHTAKLKEVTSEEHIKQLAEREIGRIAQEMRRFDAECTDLENKLSTIQNFLFKGDKEMNKFKLQMNWNQDEMEQWAMATKQKEENAMALERYRRADESEIKELNLEIEKLTKALQQHKRRLEDEFTETQAKQIELDKTAEEFCQLHDERQKLAKQWQDTIEAMKRRDEEIAAASEQYAIAQQGKDKRERTPAVQGPTGVPADDGKAAGVQRSSRNIEEPAVQCRHALEPAALYNTDKDQHLESMKQDLENARARYKATKSALEKCMNSTADAETLAKEAEQDLSAMENELKRIDKEITLQKEHMFRKNQHLFNLRQKEARLIAEISGSKAAIQNLRTKLKLLDQQALRQQELVYNGEFQIQQMERKVSRTSGERSAEETKVLQSQIQVLQMELDRVKAEESMLQAQCKKLEEEKRAQDRVKKALVKQREEITARITELELANDSCSSSLKQTLKEKEELLVQHDLQSLEVKRLKEILDMRADEVFSLENRDFQLKKSMEEQKKEIAMHREIQRATNKAIEEERHKVSVELAERDNRVKKLQTKFETLCKMSGYGSEDANGEERSQAYFVIKAAQRRDKLQREGDELDDKIRVAEKEVRALKKTLQHLEDQNSDYRKSFHRTDIGGDDAMKMMALEDQAKQAEDTFFKKKKEVTRIEMDLESETNRLKEIELQKQFAKENVMQLESAFQQVEKEVLHERSKWGKVVKKLDKMVREHQKFTGSGNGAKPKEQIMLEAYKLEEISSSLLYTLGQLANEFPEISDTLTVSVRESRLNIPSMPPGRTAAARANQAAGDYGLPRPMSARSDKSDRSVKSVGSNSSQRSGGSVSSIRMAAPVSKVRIGF
ncbi:hypothetical protein FI667_g2350, partial [Globisporangium splendens]